MKTIKVDLWSIAMAARKNAAAYEATFKKWQADQPADLAERGAQLDRWIIELGEARWRAARAEADARNGSRWADRHAKSEGK